MGVYKAPSSASATGNVKPPPDQVLVTVVLATCDRPELVGRAIESVVRQDAPAWRMLVVDDGSVGVERLVPDDDRIGYLRTTGRTGAAAARNLGLSCAETPWIVLLDDDDEMEGGFMAHFLQAIAPHGEGPAFAVSDWRILDYGPDTTPPTERRRTYQIVAGGGGQNIQQTLRAGACGLAVNRAALSKAGVMDPSYRFVEDTEWLLRLIEADCDILYASGPGFVIHNRRAPDQLSDVSHLRERIAECAILKARYGDLAGRYPPLPGLLDGLMQTYSARIAASAAAAEVE